tara:strand:+ start:226 stop:780 length:555 start_codon:yes stop_codon:yes gene_type:complete
MSPFVEDVGNPQYAIPGWWHFARGNVAMVADELYYIPIYVERSITFGRLTIDVQTGGAGGTVARLGIYEADFNSDGEMLPGALVTDAGTVSVATTGAKHINEANTLAEGFHFLAISSDGTPQLYGPDCAQAVGAPVSGQDNNAVAKNLMILSVSVADGSAALPDPATAPDALVDARFAFVMLRR